MTYLSDNFRIRVELQQSSGKFCSSGMVIGFCEDTNGAPKGNLQMGRL